MAKIPRKTQKIFAGSASNNGVFGSAQAGTKVLSNDLATIQGLPAWATGWTAATLSGLQLPPLEEMQAIQYLGTTQLAYIFQEGIAEYDSGTTYFLQSIVKKAGTYQIYGSLADNNVGNALTDATKWTLLQDLSAPTSGGIPYCWGGTAGGTANALTLTPSPAILAYTAGQPIGFIPASNNTGAATVNISGVGVRNLKKGGTLALAPNDLVAGRLTFGIDDGTNIQIINNPAFSHGADVASVSTMVLDNTGGDILNITGTTTINAITLAEGRLKVCKFAGACQLTYSSSLLLNTGAGNYTTAANDVVIFYGLASGVVVGLITPASGSSPVTGSLAALSVFGNPTNASAAATAITAGTDAYVLRRSGTTLGFGQVATGGIADAAVTLAKIANASASSKLVGSSASGSGSPYSEITLGTGLSMSGSTLNAATGLSTRTLAGGTVSNIDINLDFANNIAYKFKLPTIYKTSSTDQVRVGLSQNNASSYTFTTTTMGTQVTVTTLAQFNPLTGTVSATVTSSSGAPVNISLELYQDSSTGNAILEIRTVDQSNQVTIVATAVYTGITAAVTNIRFAWVGSVQWTTNQNVIVTPMPK